MRTPQKTAPYELTLLLVAWSMGCAVPDKPYWRADDYYLERQLLLEDPGPQIEHGRPVGFLDGLNHYVFSLPTKLLLWNWRALDHRLPESSQVLLRHYIDVNQLRALKIRHNQYAPLAEFRRLRRNRNLGAGYRYTLGLIGWLQYTLFPGRVFAGLPLIGAGDHFNPFTNTINVYSSDPTILLHEGGHAKDYIEHRWRGAGFVLPRLIPGVDLIQEATASSDAIHFLQCVGERETELRAYRTLYPAYSTYVAAYVPGGPVVTIPVVVAGHAVGRIEAGARAGEMDVEAYLANLAPEGEAKPTAAAPWCVPMGSDTRP
jgi:hypothetical protein